MICPPLLHVPTLEELAKAKRCPVEQMEGAPPPPSLWSKRVIVTQGTQTIS